MNSMFLGASQDDEDDDEAVSVVIENPSFFKVSSKFNSSETLLRNDSSAIGAKSLGASFLRTLSPNVATDPYTAANTFDRPTKCLFQETDVVSMDEECRLETQRLLKAIARTADFPSAPPQSYDALLPEGNEGLSLIFPPPSRTGQSKRFFPAAPKSSGRLEPEAPLTVTDNLHPQQFTPQRIPDPGFDRRVSNRINSSRSSLVSERDDGKSEGLVTLQPGSASGQSRTHSAASKPVTQIPTRCNPTTNDEGTRFTDPVPEHDRDALATRLSAQSINTRVPSGRPAQRATSPPQRTSINFFSSSSQSITATSPHPLASPPPVPPRQPLVAAILSSGPSPGAPSYAPGVAPTANHRGGRTGAQSRASVFSPVAPTASFRAFARQVASADSSFPSSSAAIVDHSIPSSSSPVAAFAAAATATSASFDPTTSPRVASSIELSSANPSAVEPSSPPPPPPPPPRPSSVRELLGLSVSPSFSHLKSLSNNVGSGDSPSSAPIHLLLPQDPSTSSGAERRATASSSVPPGSFSLGTKGPLVHFSSGNPKGLGVGVGIAETKQGGKGKGRGGAHALRNKESLFAKTPGAKMFRDMFQVTSPLAGSARQFSGLAARQGLVSPPPSTGNFASGAFSPSPPPASGRLPPSTDPITGHSDHPLTSPSTSPRPFLSSGKTFQDSIPIPSPTVSHHPADASSRSLEIDPLRDGMNPSPAPLDPSPFNPRPQDLDPCDPSPSIASDHIGGSDRIDRSGLVRESRPPVLRTDTTLNPSDSSSLSRQHCMPSSSSSLIPTTNVLGIAIGEGDESSVDMECDILTPRRRLLSQFESHAPTRKRLIGDSPDGDRFPRLAGGVREAVMRTDACHKSPRPYGVRDALFKTDCRAELINTGSAADSQGTAVDVGSKKLRNLFTAAAAPASMHGVDEPPSTNPVPRREGSRASLLGAALEDPVEEDETSLSPKIVEGEDEVQSPRRRRRINGEFDFLQARDLHQAVPLSPSLSLCPAAAGLPYSASSPSASPAKVLKIFESSELAVQDSSAICSTSPLEARKRLLNSFSSAADAGAKEVTLQETEAGFFKGSTFLNEAIEDGDKSPTASSVPSLPRYGNEDGTNALKRRTVSTAAVTRREIMRKLVSGFRVEDSSLATLAGIPSPLPSLSSAGSAMSGVTNGYSNLDKASSGSRFLQRKRPSSDHEGEDEITDSVMEDEPSKAGDDPSSAEKTPHDLVKPRRFSRPGSATAWILEDLSTNPISGMTTTLRNDRRLLPLKETLRQALAAFQGRTLFVSAALDSGFVPDPFAAYFVPKEAGKKDDVQSLCTTRHDPDDAHASTAGSCVVRGSDENGAICGSPLDDSVKKERESAGPNHASLSALPDSSRLYPVACVAFAWAGSSLEDAPGHGVQALQSPATRSPMAIEPGDGKRKRFAEYKSGSGSSLVAATYFNAAKPFCVILPKRVRARLMTRSGQDPSSLDGIQLAVAKGSMGAVAKGSMGAVAGDSADGVAAAIALLPRYGSVLSVESLDFTPTETLPSPPSSFPAMPGVTKDDGDDGTGNGRQSALVEGDAPPVPSTHRDSPSPSDPDQEELREVNPDPGRGSVSESRAFAEGLRLGLLAQDPAPALAAEAAVTEVEEGETEETDLSLSCAKRPRLSTQSNILANAATASNADTSMKEQFAEEAYYIDAAKNLTEANRAAEVDVSLASVAKGADTSCFPPSAPVPGIDARWPVALPLRVLGKLSEGHLTKCLCEVLDPAAAEEGNLFDDNGGSFHGERGQATSVSCHTLVDPVNETGKKRFEGDADLQIHDPKRSPTKKEVGGLGALRLVYLHDDAEMSSKVGHQGGIGGEGATMKGATGWKLPPSPLNREREEGVGAEASGSSSGGLKVGALRGGICPGVAFGDPKGLRNFLDSGSRIAVVQPWVEMQVPSTVEVVHKFQSLCGASSGAELLRSSYNFTSPSDRSNPCSTSGQDQPLRVLLALHVRGILPADTQA